MAIQIAPKKPTVLPECLQGTEPQRKMTPEEVKAVLTYTFIDALNDIDKQVQQGMDILLEYMPAFGEWYEKALVEYHNECIIVMDTHKIQFSREIMQHLSDMGGEINYDFDSSAEELGVFVEAYFPKEVSFKGKMELLQEIISESEFKATIPYGDNRLCLSFYVQIGRYVHRDNQ